MDQLIKYFPWLAGLAGVIALWGQIKIILKKFFNLFVIEIEAENRAAQALELYIKSNSKCLSLGQFCFNGREEYVKVIERRIAVLFQVLSFEPQFYLLNKTIILMMNAKGEKAHKIWSDFRIKIYFLRFTLDKDKIMIDSVNFYNEERKKINKRFFIKQINGMGKSQNLSDLKNSMQVDKENKSWLITDLLVNKPLIWKRQDIGFGTKENKFSCHIFSEETTELKNIVNRWKESELWYKKKGVLWRHGALLWGKSGSGKSATVRNICKDSDLPLFILSIGEMTNKELTDNWLIIQEDIPCCVLFEDIDIIFNKRQNLLGEMGGGLTFDCLLNSISGALPAEGIFIFITTNNYEYLDDSLIRPGRLDCNIKLNNMVEEDRIKLANVILSDYPEFIDKLIEETNNMTPAQVSDIFSKKALELYWQK